MFNGGEMMIYRCITPLHCGTAEGGGVDLPVARERITNFPIIPSSSLKGVWRDFCRNHGMDFDRVNIAFGKDPEASETGTERFYAGCLVFNDAQILFLPVRSGGGVFAMITCPIQVRRYIKFLKLTNPGISAPAIEPPGGPDTISIFQDAGPLGKPKETLYLEDIELSIGRVNNPLPDKPAIAFSGAVKNRLALVSDDVFAWFCENALEIRAHNKLKPVTKISDNLWYEEAVPAEAVFFSPVFYGPPRISGNTEESGNGLLSEMRRIYKGNPLFQAGGLETTGRGWLEIQFVNLDASGLNQGGRNER